MGRRSARHQRVLGAVSAAAAAPAFRQLQPAAPPRSRSFRRAALAAGAAGPATEPGASGLMEPCLGVLLTDFFRFYGRVVNMPEV
jgi:hypothetical protein